MAAGPFRDILCPLISSFLGLREKREPRETQTWHLVAEWQRGKGRQRVEWVSLVSLGLGVAKLAGYFIMIIKEESAIKEDALLLRISLV